jgi:hypothetical protein
MRSPTTMAIRFVGLLLVTAGAVAPSTAATEQLHSFALKVLWSAPVVGPNAESSSVPASGLVLTAQAISPDGRIVLLGKELAAVAGAGSSRMAWDVPPHPHVLLTDAERSGADGGVILKLRGTPGPGLISRLLGTPSHMPDASTLVIGAGGEIWVGGATNMELGMSEHRSDGYLARVDATGTPLWEKVYGDEGGRRRTMRRRIERMVRMPSGDLAISGGWTGWLARIAPDGTLLWEHHMGTDSRIAVAALPDNRLMVVGFPTGPRSGAYDSYPLLAWIIDDSGNIITQKRIRSCGDAFEHCASARIIANQDAIYVATNWSAPPDVEPQLIEVTKLDLDGTPLWSTSLPNTVRSVPTARPRWNTCSPILAVTPRRDAVLICNLKSEIQLYHLDGSSGSYQESHFSFPECQNGRAAGLLLAPQDDQTMILSGSPTGWFRGISCTWIGRLTAVP